jgi:hypothetical protein
MRDDSDNFDSHERLAQALQRYAAAVAVVIVRKPNGDINQGTAYHIGDGVFLTARHVVEDNEIIDIKTTMRSYHTLGDPITDEERTNRQDTGPVLFVEKGLVQPIRYFSPSEGKVMAGPFYHVNREVDLAALIVSGIDAPTIPLGSHLDDWIDYGLILMPVLVLGYPRIPLAQRAELVASVGVVNTIVDLYTEGREDRHPRFIISTTARGGFSGGPAIAASDFSLGVITEAMTTDSQAPELGFMAVVTVEPILNMLDYNRIVPTELKEFWGKNDPEFWSY